MSSDNSHIELPKLMFAELERLVGEYGFLKSKDCQLSQEEVDSLWRIELLKNLLKAEGFEVELNGGNASEEAVVG